MESVVSGFDQRIFEIHDGDVASGATISGTALDCTLHESFSVSMTATRKTADSNVDVIVEHRNKAADSWEQLDLVNLAVTAAASKAHMNKVYSTMRRFNRVRIVEKTGTADITALAIQILKPSA